MSSFLRNFHEVPTLDTGFTVWHKLALVIILCFY
jgi:hypothetical protein